MFCTAADRTRLIWLQLAAQVRHTVIAQLTLAQPNGFELLMLLLGRLVLVQGLLSLLAAVQQCHI
jgi:hypothetical protein